MVVRSKYLETEEAELRLFISNEGWWEEKVRNHEES